MKTAVVLLTLLVVAALVGFAVASLIAAAKIKRETEADLVRFSEHLHRINCDCGRRRDGRWWVDPKCVQLTQASRSKLRVS